MESRLSFLTIWIQILYACVISLYVKPVNAKDGDDMMKHCSDARSFCFGVKSNIGYFNSLKENSSTINDNGCISNRDCDMLLVAYKFGRDKYMWSLSAMNDENFTTKTELIVSENKHIGDKYLSALMIRKYSNVSSNDVSEDQWIIDAHSIYMGSKVNCGQYSGCYEKISVSQDGTWSQTIFETSTFLAYDTYEVSIEKPLYVYLMQKIGKYDSIKYGASNTLSCYLFKEKDYSNSCSVEQRREYESPLVGSTAKQTPPMRVTKLLSTEKLTQPMTTQELTTSTPPTKKTPITDALVSNQQEDGAIKFSPVTTADTMSESAITLNLIELNYTSTTPPPIEKKNATTYIIVGVIAGILILIIIVGCLIYRYYIVPKQIRHQRTNYGRLIPGPFIPEKPNQEPKSAVGAEIIPNNPSKKGAKKLLAQGKSEVSYVSSVASMNENEDN